MFIPDATIKQILDKADIVAIVGEHIKLEKKGNDYKGICPFHNDSNPSLSVSPNKKVFKCFSCGETGNAITFVQKYKHVSFPEAVKIVGEKCGIDVNIGNNSRQQSFEKLYKIMQEATFYYEFYLKNSIEGKVALEYLHNRNLDDQIIKRFRIGLASKENNLLFEAMTKKEDSYLPVDLIKCGLIHEKNHYDMFRNRIIFPIDDQNGNIVGFSGRIYQPSQKGEPKYINTVENDIFKKGNILYNYSFALNDIKKKNRVYIFEGFMDVIAAYRASVLNTVATMGTALTDNHIKMIKKLTSNIVLCFDGDNAGITATKRAIQLFLKENMNVSVMLLPEGMDPDEYLEKYGKDSLNDFLENKFISSIDYLYSLEKRNLIISDINSVERFKKNVFSYLKMFNSRYIENQIIKRMSADLELNSSDISNDFSKTDFEYISKENNNDLESGNKLKSDLKLRYLKAEQMLVCIAFKGKEYCDKIARLLPFELNLYVDKENRDLFLCIVNYYHQNHNMDYNEFCNSVDVDEKMKERLENILDETIIGDDSFIDELIVECAEMIQKYAKDKKLDVFRNRGNDLNDEALRTISELKKKTIKIKNQNKE